MIFHHGHRGLRVNRHWITRLGQSGFVQTTPFPVLGHLQRHGRNEITLLRTLNQPMKVAYGIEHLAKAQLAGPLVRNGLLGYGIGQTIEQVERRSPFCFNQIVWQGEIDSAWRLFNDGYRHERSVLNRTFSKITTTPAVQGLIRVERRW